VQVVAVVATEEDTEHVDAAAAAEQASVALGVAFGAQVLRSPNGASRATATRGSFEK
jgi:hypothetical protein